MKKVMPYVQMVKERYDLIGERALSLTSPFDEMKILKENSDYITGTLELQGINVSKQVRKMIRVQLLFQIKYSEEGNQVIQENSYPGHPTYEFYKVPSVTLEAVNCQSMSGNFSVFLDIQDAFTGLTCRERISKFQKVDVNRVKLYRKMFDRLISRFRIFSRQSFDKHLIDLH